MYNDRKVSCLTMAEEGEGAIIQEATEVIGGDGLLTLLLVVMVSWVLPSIKVCHIVAFSGTSGKLLFRLRAQPGA